MFSGFYKDSIGKTQYNASYYPEMDTHQWMTRQAVYLLQNDPKGKSAYGKLTEKDENGDHKLWYWVTRGVRRADSSAWEKADLKKEGKDHFHDFSTHRGSYAPDEISAANFAQEAFDEANDLWKQDKKSEAMYKLGIALHYVQDLRVPQHNWHLLANHLDNKPYPGRKGIETFYNENKNQLQAKISNKWQSPFYKESFKRFGIHQNPNTAYGWVDRSAHISSRYFEAAAKLTSPDYQSTKPLFQSAQRFSAGFLDFFFAEANKPTKPKSIKVEITWNKSLFSANPTLTNPQFFSGYDYDFIADNYNYSPDLGQQEIAIDDPMLTNEINNSIYNQKIYLNKPYEQGTYSINADFWNVPCGYNVEAKAKVFIDNILAKVIESPPIINECILVPYWQILNFDEPSDKVDIINYVDYLGIS